MENLILNMLKISEFLNANEKFVFAEAIDGALASLLKFAKIEAAGQAFMEKIERVISQYKKPFLDVREEVGRIQNRLMGMIKRGGPPALMTLFNELLAAVNEIYDSAWKKQPDTSIQWGDNMKQDVEAWKTRHAEDLSSGLPAPPVPEELPSSEERLSIGPQ